MGHFLKDSLRKMAQKAQESFNLDEEKTEKFIQKAEKAVDVTAEKLNQFEQQTNAYEGNLAQRLKAAKEAFMQKTDAPPSDPSPQAKPSSKKPK